MHALVFVREQRGEMRHHAVFITSPALASSTRLLATTYLTEKETTGESQLRQDIASTLDPRRRCAAELVGCRLRHVTRHTPHTAHCQATIQRSPCREDMTVKGKTYVTSGR